MPEDDRAQTRDAPAFSFVTRLPYSDWYPARQTGMSQPPVRLPLRRSPDRLFIRKLLFMHPPWNAAAAGWLEGLCQRKRRSTDMVTMVGNESSIEKLVTNLIYLERDAIAAYESTIERLDDKTLSSQVESFRQDHLQHLDVLNEMARELAIDAPTEGDMKQMLTTGKIAMADMMGDGAILKAMKTNEDDTVTAYERASQHQEAMPKSKAFFEKALADEQRHRAWMQETASRL